MCIRDRFLPLLYGEIRYDTEDILPAYRGNYLVFVPSVEMCIRDRDQSDYKGMTYEGYGPHGVAVFVDTLTDNTTRTVADVWLIQKISGRTSADYCHIILRYAKVLSYIIDILINKKES